MGAINNTFYAIWWMPFSKKATLKLINKGDQSHAINFTIISTPLEASADSLMRFHAIWHKGLKTKQQSASDKRADIVLADFKKGNYSGWTLTGTAFG